MNQHVRCFVILIFLLKISFTTEAQVSVGGNPLAFYDNALASDVPIEKMPPLDMKAIHAEDAAEEGKNIPPRFGFPIQVNLDQNSKGVWKNLPDGGRLWQLLIYSPEALSLNLNYSKFFLPEGATFFVYNPDTKEKLGAFSSRNNHTNGTFATGFTKGDKVLLEYYEPANAIGKGVICVNEVIHGYRYIKDMLKDFGDSGSCNNNVICPLSAGWEDQTKGVAMLLTSGNSRFCSGSLINTTVQNCTPYLLTANHCVSTVSAGSTVNYIFMFNYNSPQCTPSQDGPTNQTVQGATCVAKATESDFALFELNDNPADFYDVYFNGWSISQTPSSAAVGIHHPSGDVKKISFENDPLTQGAWSSIISHWIVNDWDSGTTEGGSSGSPLFNSDKRIIGQLHGGGAACGNNLSDKYGGTWYSWDQNGTANTVRLKPWLDPNNSGVTAINGTYDICAPPVANDAGVSSIVVPANGSQICTATYTPEIILTNYGANNLTSVTITYNVDGGTNMTYSWSGNLAPSSSTNITLPTLSAPAVGNHTFNAVSSSPNGSTDGNTSNDAASATFYSSGGVPCYCASAGSNTADEWIQTVTLNAYSNNSGNDGGYADYTNLVWTFNPNETVNLTLTTGYTGTVYNEYWLIWIDYNQNGSFNDTGELVFDSGAAVQNGTSGSFVISGAAPLGQTRMRVSMKYNAAPTSCETFQWGEVEDYTVEIVDPSTCQSNVVESTTYNSGNNISISSTNYIIADNTINSGAIVYYSAGDYIDMLPNFWAIQGCDYEAVIAPCVAKFDRENMPPSSAINLFCSPNPAQNQTNFYFELRQNETIQIEVLDMNGRNMLQQIFTENTTEGKHQFRLNTSDFNNGIYLFVLKSSEEVKTLKFVVLQ